MTYKLEFSDEGKQVTLETDDSYKDGEFIIHIDPDSDYGKYAHINISILRQMEKLISMREQQE